MSELQDNTIQSNVERAELFGAIMKTIVSTQFSGNQANTKTSRFQLYGNALNLFCDTVENSNNKFEEDENKSGSIITYSGDIIEWIKLYVSIGFGKDKELHSQSVPILNNVTKDGNVLNEFGPLYLAVDVHIHRKVMFLEWDVQHLRTIDLIQIESEQ